MALPPAAEPADAPVSAEAPTEGAETRTQRSHSRVPAPPMPNWRMFLVFLSMVLLIMGGVHGYLYWRLVLETALPEPWSGALGWLFVLALAGIPLSFVLSRMLDKSLARLFVVPVYVWLGLVFQAFYLVLALDLLRGVAWLVTRLAGALEVGPFLDAALLFDDPGRSPEAWRIAAGGAAAASLLLTMVGLAWGLRFPVVKRLEVALPNLPPALDGFTILQLSDLHLDLVKGRRWLGRVVHRANGLEPDLVAITGDLAEGSVAKYARDVEPLRSLSAPRGVYFVTGNHEYFHDLAGWLRHLEEMGIRVLRNEGVAMERNGASFHLAGIDDHDGGRIAPGHGPDLARALQGRDGGRPVVLLAHQPRAILEAAGMGVELVLTGHTHGGQIWPFSYLVYLQQPFVRGLQQVGGTVGYVSSGTGFWGPPMRLGTTAEMTLFTLRSPKDGEDES